MLKVLGRVTSINVRKVLWAADELGMPYEREDWGLPLRDPKVPEFLTLNPNGQVPVVIDDGFVLWESNAILIYLAEKAGDGRLLPMDLRERARVLQWLSWQVSELGPAWGYAVQAIVRKTPGYDDRERIAQSLRAWNEKVALLEGQLEKGTPFIAGETFTIADVALGLSVHRWMSAEAEKPEFAAVREYYTRLLGREAGARWMGAATP